MKCKEQASVAPTQFLWNLTNFWFSGFQKIRPLRLLILCLLFWKQEYCSSGRTLLRSRNLQTSEQVPNMVFPTKTFIAVALLFLFLSPAECGLIKKKLKKSEKSAKRRIAEGNFFGWSIYHSNKQVLKKRKKPCTKGIWRPNFRSPCHLFLQNL